MIENKDRTHLQPHVEFKSFHACTLVMFHFVRALT